jgi:hypothetical protein
MDLVHVLHYTVVELAGQLQAVSAGLGGWWAVSPDADLGLDDAFLCLHHAMAAVELA